MKSLLLCILAFAASVCAADFSGKWVGTYTAVTADGDTQTGNVTLTLTQNGSELTGTVGTDTGEQNQIAKGHVDGEEVSFESQTDGPVMKVTLHLEDGHLRGIAKGDDGGSVIEAKIDLTRQTDQ